MNPANEQHRIYPRVIPGIFPPPTQQQTNFDVSPENPHTIIPNYNTHNIGRPVNAPIPLRPVNVPIPLRPVNAPIPLRPVNAPIPLRPVNAPIPLRPVNTPIPLRPVNVPIPLQPVNVPIPLRLRPVNVPIQPVNVPIRPVNVPIQPVNVPIQPVNIPIQPVNIPIQPVNVPIQPVNVPIPPPPINVPIVFDERSDAIIGANILVKDIRGLIDSYDYMFENKVDIVLRGHKYPVSFVGNLSDGRIVSAGGKVKNADRSFSYEQSIKIWDPINGNELQNIPIHADSILILNNDNIAVANRVELLIFDPNTGEEVFVFQYEHNLGEVIDEIFEISNNALVLALRTSYTSHYNYLLYLDINTKKSTKLLTVRGDDILLRRNRFRNNYYNKSVSALSDDKFIVSSSGGFINIYDTNISIDTPIIDIVNEYSKLSLKNLSVEDDIDEIYGELKYSLSEYPFIILDNNDVILSDHTNSIRSLNDKGDLSRISKRRNLNNPVFQTVQIDKNKIAIIAHKLCIYNIIDDTLTQCSDISYYRIMGILPGGQMVLQGTDYNGTSSILNIYLVHPDNCQNENIFSYLEKEKDDTMYEYYRNNFKSLTVLKNGRISIPLENGDIQILK